MGKDLRHYLPRGMQTKLAKKYRVSRQAISLIIGREDYKNHPKLMKEVVKLTKKAMDTEKLINDTKSNMYGFKTD